jgi:hypothetical protein
MMIRISCVWHNHNRVVASNGINEHWQSMMYYGKDANSSADVRFNVYMYIARVVC